MFDDWHLLAASMAGIAPHVDEIVVVDGAYRWMAPFLEAAGRDPARSDPRVREALAPFAGKLRWIEGLWDNELHKRAAGYAACRKPLRLPGGFRRNPVLRRARSNRHLASGRAVAEMQMPIAVTPGLIRGTPGQPIERAGAAGSTASRSARTSISAICGWSCPRAERARLAARPAAVSPEPIAFNAHLTHGARRQRGQPRPLLRAELPAGGPPHPSAPGFGYTAEAGFAPLLEALPVRTLMEYLLGPPDRRRAAFAGRDGVAAHPAHPRAASDADAVVSRLPGQLAALKRRPRAPSPRRSRRATTSTSISPRAKPPRRSAAKAPSTSCSPGLSTWRSWTW